jgi:hypothetical protein
VVAMDGLTNVHGVFSPYKWGQKSRARRAPQRLRPVYLVACIYGTIVPKKILTEEFILKQRFENLI